MSNESEGPITVLTNDVASINLALGQVLERLDTIKGLRGDPTVYAAVTVGAPGGQEQAARLADIPVESPENILFWVLAQKNQGSGGTWIAPSIIATGGIANLENLGAGVATDQIGDVTDITNPGSADVSPVLNAFAAFVVKINAINADINDMRDNITNIMAALASAGVLV